jgi:hypothetical protein
MRTWILPLTLGLGLPAAGAIALVGCNGEDEEPSEANCVNEVDDDNDGLTDCEDPDCAATLACGGGDTDSGDTGDTGDTDTGPPPIPTIDEGTAVVWGEEDGDWAGFAAASSVDLNGDGTNDLVVGAPNHDCEDDSGNALDNAGAIYVAYGPIEGGTSLADADIKICGDRPEAQLGWNVALAEDVTGDGVADVIASSPSERNGRVYVFSGLVPPSDGNEIPLDGEGVLTSDIVGEGTEMRFGHALHVGSLRANGGRPTLVVGSEAWSSDLDANLGRVYLFENPVDESPRASRAGTRFTGIEAGGGIGRDITLGDFDGDGNSDIAIAAMRASSPDVAGSGQVFIKYGGSGEDGFTGFRWEMDDMDADFSGVRPDSGLGQIVDGEGDFNDDGYADLLISAYLADREAGSTWVVFGGVDRWDGSLTTDDMDVRYDGETGFDRSGHGAAFVGDLTADGVDDVAVGAFGADGQGLNDPGMVYLLAGGGGGGAFDLEQVADARWIGALEKEQVGHRIIAAGDATGDDRDDFLVGAYRSGVSGDDAGAVYLVPGPVSQ